MRELIICTGNILDKSFSFNKGNDAAVEELFESIKSCLEDQKEIPKQDCVEMVANNKQGQLTENEEAHDRNDMKVTVKIFINSMDQDYISEAIEKGLKNTSSNLDFLDSVVISFSNQSDANPLSFETLQKGWNFLESNVDNGKVKLIGISDIETQLFIQLYNWAKIKPNFVQINLATCCVVPPELAEFCKQNEVQLLTHSDPLNILPEEKLDLLMNPFSEKFVLSENNDEIKWVSKWVLRFQVHLKCRGVLSTKGYIASISN